MNGVRVVFRAATLHKPHVATPSRREFVDVNCARSVRIGSEAGPIGSDRGTARGLRNFTEEPALPDQLCSQAAQEIAQETCRPAGGEAPCDRQPAGQHLQVVIHDRQPANRDREDLRELVQPAVDSDLTVAVPLAQQERRRIHRVTQSSPPSADLLLQRIFDVTTE
jgi:hypothetical protein